MRLRQRFRRKAADMDAPPHLAADKPRIFQRLDMFGSGSERYVERPGQLAHRSLTKGKVTQHRAPRSVAKGMKDGVEM